LGDPPDPGAESAAPLTAILDAFKKSKPNNQINPIITNPVNLVCEEVWILLARRIGYLLLER
jgi:hypothetical protein